MADKDHDLDDFDLNDELDIPDFDDSGLDGPSANDRKPVERVAGGFLEGVKSTSLDRNFQRRMIRTSLPDGYGKAFDDLDEAKRLGQDLYDTAASTLRPYEKTIKKIGRRVTEKADRFLPESLSNKLKELTEPDNDRAGEKVDYREAEITANLAEIFDAQAKADAETKAEDQTRENVRDVIDEQRHKTELDVLKTMRSGMDRMVAYQDRVTASYQKKSLELQFRQLFVARDQYTLLEAHVKENKLQLQAISKNTALPEFVKLRGSEAAKQILRERAYGGAINAIGNRSQDFIGGLRDKALTRVKEFTRSVGDGLQGIGDAMDMAEGSGVKLDGMEMGGQMAAGALMEEGVARYGRRFGELLGRIPGVTRMGDRLEYFSDNKEDTIRSFLERLADKDDGGLGDDFAFLTEEEQEKRRQELAERTTYEKAKDFLDRGTGGAQAGIARMLLDFIGPESTADRRFSQGDLSNLSTEVVPYTSLTDRSITEIIPGLLTNILHETEMIRTGRDDIERRVYDAEARTFRRESDVQADLMQTVMPDERRTAVREDVDAIVAELDQDKVLSEDARQAMRRQVLEDLSSGRGFRVERYSDPSKLADTYGSESATEIAALMQNKFLDDEGQFRGGDDAAQALRNRVSMKYRTAADTLPNYQEAIAKIYSVYGPETLRDMGLMSSAGGGDNALDTKGILDNFVQDNQLTQQGLRAQGAERLIPELPRTDPRALTMDTSPLADESDGVDLGRIESSLSTMQSMLSRFVEVATGRSYEEQFKNVLKAIGQLDVREHVDLTNDWLKKIYDLLVDCCGPGGGGGGTAPPTGPAPEGPGPLRSAWDRTQLALTPLQDRARDFGETLRQQSGTRLRAAQEGTQQWFDSLRQNDALQSRLAPLRDRATQARTRLGEGVEAARQLTLDDVRNGVQSGVDRLRNLEMPQVDLRGVQGQFAQGYDALSTRVQDYGQRARSAGMDAYGRVADTDIGQAVRGRVDQARQALSEQDLIDLQGLRESAGQRAGQLSEQARELFGQLQERFEGRPEVDMQAIKDRLDNLISLQDYQLQDQPRLMMERGRETLAAAGDGVNRMRGNLQSQMTQGSSQLRSRFDRAYGNVTGGMDSIRDRLSDTDFDLSSYFSDDAANDPRMMLSALQKVSDDTLARLEEMDMGSRVKSLTDNVAGSTRSILATLKDRIDQAKLPATQAQAQTADAGGPTQPTDFWSKAWEMLTNLKGHMDEKTAQLIEAMGNLSVGGGDGEPGMFKRLAGKVSDGVGGIASYYGKTLSGFGSLLKGGGQGAGGLLKGLGGRLGGMIRGRDKGMQEEPIVDIYLEGQEAPVMLARDLRRGQYFDQESGDVVQRISDIEGAVIDQDENVVVTAEDVAEGRLYTLGGEEVKPGIMSRLGKGYLNYTTMPARALFSGAKKLGQYLVDKAKEPQDIYVRGEDTPRLLAVVMKNGGYLSKATEEVINSPQDIDGDVIDLQGNTLLTEAELRDPGIVNARGKAIRSVGSGLGEIAKKAGSMLGSYYKGVWNAGKGLVSGVGNLLGFGDGEGGGLFGGGGKQVEWLEKIYNLLDQRIEKPETIREGSWKQLMNDDEDESVDPRDPRAMADAKKGLFGGGLGGLFGGLLDKLNPFSGDGGVGVDVDLPMGGDDVDRDDRRDRRNRRGGGRGGKRGFLSKLWGGAKSLGRGALNVGKAALPLAGSALALGGKALAATGAALGSVISAPVALAGAAVAAVGVGGYLLYKNFANDPEGPLHRFRLMQYGIDPDAGDPVARINALEDKLEGEVSLGGGQPTINQGVDAEELLEICGIDPEDREAVQQWANWFQQRFKPVFLSHVAVLSSLSSGTSLADVDDDLDESLKTTYLKRVHFKEGSDAPYRVTMYLPFDDLESMAGPAQVNAEYDKAMEAVQVEKKDDEDVGTATRSRIDPSRPGAVVRTNVTEKDKLNAGIDRRKKDSPTAQDMDGLSKEAYENLSSTPQGRRVLERRRKNRAAAAQQGGTPVPKPMSLKDEAEMTDAEIIARYEAEHPDAGFDPMDTYRKQVARKEAYERHGLDSSHITIPEIRREGDLVDDGTSETRRRDRAWAAAAASAAGEDGTSSDKRVEERRRRDQRVTAQTEGQTQKNAAMLNTAVNRMVSILSDSHGVQRNIDKNLSEMNKMLKAKYEKDLKDENREQFQPQDEGGWMSNLFGGDEKKDTKSHPWPTSR